MKTKLSIAFAIVCALLASQPNLSLAQVTDTSAKIAPTPIQIPQYKDPYPTHGFVRLSGAVGYSYRLASPPDGASSEAKSLYDKTRSGIDITASAAYVGRSNLGVGIIFNRWFGSGDVPTILTDPRGNSIVGSISMKDNMLFASPAFFVRTGNEHLTFNTLVGVGYHGYSSTITVSASGESVSVSAEGSSVGFVVDLGLDIKLAQRVYLGFGINVFTGFLSEIEIKYPDGTKEKVKLENEERENLSRIGFNGGLKFCF